MAAQVHDICLESDQHFDGRLPPHHLGFLFSDLPLVIRGAVAMALRNRSHTPGKLPNWVKRASDIRFLGHRGNGETHLRFELPSLGDAASAIYEQREFFDSGRPDGNLTGLDLFMKVVADIDENRADSNAFDPQLLRQFAKLHRFFKQGPFTGVRISGSETNRDQKVTMTRSTVQNSRQLYGRTPTPQRTRIVGQLDGIEASTQRFSLLLDSGERVAGVYPEEISDKLQVLWRQRVLVLGTSVFRTSGNLLRVEAESIEEGKGVASLFSSAPIAGNGRLDLNRLRRSQGSRSGMVAIMNRWPGDETEEEIEAALELIS